MTATNLLAAALHYAELGYRVFPCVPGKSTPLTEHGFHDATVDPEQIERWWSQWPTANVAIATAGLLVVDIDPLDGNAPNPWLKDDPDKQLDLAAAPTAITPRGGRHHIFRKPAEKGWRCTTSRLAPHVDTRTDGGYIVAPPSVRPDGQYSWVPGLELNDPPDCLPEPPLWLIEELDRLASGAIARLEQPTLLAQLASSTTTQPEQAALPAQLANGAIAEPGQFKENPIPQGQRNDTLTSLAGTMRRRGMSRAEIAAALHQANKDRCKPPLDPGEVDGVATSVARYTPDQIATAMAEGHWEQMLKGQLSKLAPLSLAELVERYPNLRRPVIHGLLRQGETMNIIAAPKVGKALAADTPILTDGGWKTMAELQPGMKVHAADGTLTPVVAVSEIMHGRPCYRVTTRSGATVVADRDHLWQVAQREQTEIVTTEKLAAGQRGRRWLLPTNQALVRDEAQLPLDPWLLGYWLGNGTAREGAISVNQNDLEEVVQQVQQAGFTIGRLARKSGCVTFTVRGLKVILRNLGLLNCKHIPEAYLLASQAQRAALLAGLLDADGHAATQPNGSGIVEFTTTEQALFFPTLMLVRSLGYKASVSVGRAMLNGVDCGPKLRITFAAGKQSTPFRLSRRTAALPDREPSQRAHRDAVKSVVQVPSVPVKCIQVAHPSGLFLAGRDLMVTHNSWLVTDLALAVATGRPWLDTFETDQGNVLIIDNELHSETSANRIPKVAAARQIGFNEVGQRVFVQNLRGHWQDIFSLGSYFNSLEPGKFRIIILDAMYRFMPREMDENDNGTMANIYNAIDRYADLLGCCFVLIHHTSKGNQSGKAITDVGAGAGSQSRATDTHLVLRPHEEDDVVVLEAAVRSWPPVMPRCLRWTFPVWTPADDLDPTLLRIERPRRARKAEEEEPQEEQLEWTIERFTSTFVGVEPKLVDALLVEANQQGINDFKCRTLLRKAEAVGLVYRWDMGRGRLGYATQAPPPEEAVEENPEELNAKRLSVETLLRQSPELSTAEIARRCGVSTRYVRRLRTILASPESPAGTDPGTEPRN
jgi:hypothetical protein